MTHETLYTLTELWNVFCTNVGCENYNVFLNGKLFLQEILHFL